MSAQDPSPQASGMVLCPRRGGARLLHLPSDTTAAALLALSPGSCPQGHAGLWGLVYTCL